MSKKKIVISGINLTLGGALVVMIDCLEQLLIYTEKHDIEIIALIHSKELYKINTSIQYIEFPKSKSSWFYRLYYEYIYFRKLSKKLKPDIWISMQDISPNIVCDKKYVYCHNPTPFFKATLNDWKYGIVTSLFSLFYKYLYKINIKSNTAVIVQQNWLRENFQKMYKLNNVIVAYPDTCLIENVVSEEIYFEKEYKHFFYPSFPRSFKNFELICEAFILLPKEIRNRIRIYLTIDETLNLYSKDLVNKYKQFPEIKFIGLLTRQKVASYYKSIDALIFPSRLETWGLPITEFKEYNKSMFLADLPYAYETLGTYDKAVFFDVYSPLALAQILQDFVEDNLEYVPTKQKKIKDPFAKNWTELFDYIIKT